MKAETDPGPVNDEPGPLAVVDPGYAAPTLIRLGTLRELTLGTGSDASDAMGGNGDIGSV